MKLIWHIDLDKLQTHTIESIQFLAESVAKDDKDAASTVKVIEAYLNVNRYSK